MQRREQVGNKGGSGAGIEPDIDGNDVAQKLSLFIPRLRGAKALQKRFLRQAEFLIVFRNGGLRIDLRRGIRLLPSGFGDDAAQRMDDAAMAALEIGRASCRERV